MIANNWKEYVAQIKEEAFDSLFETEGEYYVTAIAEQAAKQYMEEAKISKYENCSVLDCFDDYAESEFERDVDDPCGWRGSFTGNNCGSRFCNAGVAQENISNIIWDEEFANACKMFGYDGVPTERGAETVEVIATELAIDEFYSELKNAWDKAMKLEIERQFEYHFGF